MLEILTEIRLEQTRLFHSVYPVPLRWSLDDFRD